MDVESAERIAEATLLNSADWAHRFEPATHRARTVWIGAVKSALVLVPEPDAWILVDDSPASKGGAYVLAGESFAAFEADIPAEPVANVPAVSLQVVRLTHECRADLMQSRIEREYQRQWTFHLGFEAPVTITGTAIGNEFQHVTEDEFARTLASRLGWVESAIG